MVVITFVRANDTNYTQIFTCYHGRVYVTDKVRWGYSDSGINCISNGLFLYDKGGSQIFAVAWDRLALGHAEH